MNGLDFSEYRKKLEELGADLDESARRTLSQMNAKGMEVTQKRTPTGKYPSIVNFITKDGKHVTFKVAHKQGGTLKKGWHNDGTKRKGKGYEARHSNNVYYAGYVNDGHRVVNMKHETVGYVKGRRMLEKGQLAAKESADSIFSAEIRRVKSKGGW